MRPSTSAEAPSPPAVSDVFSLADALSELSTDGHDFAEVFRSPSGSLSLTVARWPAGSVDDQQPHTEDEVYHVTAGRARLVIGDEAVVVGPGSVVFVGADIEHRFVEIETDLEVLVFWSRAAQPSSASSVFARRRAAADSRLARVTATFALPAAVRGRSAALPAAAFDALEAATFLRWAVLLAAVRFFGAPVAVAPTSSSRCAALAFVISRLFRRAALLGWMIPFSAALSRALIAAATASGPDPSARPRAISEARWTRVFASLRVRRFTARRRSDWRTRFRAEGVRAPFQVRAVRATWDPQLEIVMAHGHSHAGAPAEAGV